ncbi:unannotated protein [freshwater metagenome]|uniref:Unannotated protein n=1 Tax=freshwater metagenome TaxID=449393 RepID=A0A6J6MY11_9ZZZZ
MLFLIDLARLNEWINFSETIDAKADVLKHLRLIPHDQLRAHDAGV